MSSKEKPVQGEAVAWRVRPHDTDLSAARVINDARLAESMAAHRWLVEPLTELPTPAESQPQQGAVEAADAEKAFFARDFYEEAKAGKVSWPCGTYSPTIGQQAVAVDDAMRRELKRDAERYRWLRDESGNDIAAPFVCGVHGAPMGDAGWLTGDLLDAAIDAAMNGAN